MLSNNANLSSNAQLHNNQRNSNSDQHFNAGSVQQMGQQNPNILIQTGHAETGPHTVLINLNTLPQRHNANTQPHTVQVSLSGPPPSFGQPSQQTMHYNDQQVNAFQQELANAGQPNRRHASGSHSNPQTLTDNAHNTAQPVHSSTLRNGQPRENHVTNQTRSRRNTENTNPYSEQTRSQLGHSLSISDDDSDVNEPPRQRPWDRMHGTPAYPNRQVDRYESQNATEHTSSSYTEGEHLSPNQRPRRSPVNEQVRSISRSSRRNLLRYLANSAAQRRSRVDRNVPRQVTQPNEMAQPRADHQRFTSSQNNPSQRPGMENTNRTVPVPQHPNVQMQTGQPTHSISKPGPDQRQTGPSNAATPNSFTLTQAALQQHTSWTPDHFVNRNQQTQAALQHPGTQSTSPQHAPTRQVNRVGQIAPVPPPVLLPDEFKSLPREHLQKPNAVKPVNVMRRPVAMHHGHRPPNMPRHPRTIHNTLHRQVVNPHMHTSARWHGNTPGFPVHMSQVRLTLHKDCFA